jgi:hypothetical protein
VTILSQRPLPDDTQHSQETNVHAPGGNRNPQSQQAGGHRSMPYTAQPLGSAHINISMINFRMLHVRAAQMWRKRKQNYDMEKEYKYSFWRKPWNWDCNIKMDFTGIVMKMWRRWKRIRVLSNGGLSYDGCWHRGSVARNIMLVNYCHHWNKSALFSCHVLRDFEFRNDVEEIAFFWLVKQRAVGISYWRFGTTYRSSFGKVLRLRSA